MKNSLSTKGQVLIEFSLSVMLFICFLIGSLSLLNTQWKKLKCKKNTFEKAHSTLMSPKRTLGESWIGKKEHCSKGIESVQFKSLETFEEYP